ncbi:MAG TPA: tail fiber protein [Methylomirabilota bacterium]|nr:tail fiber protein [Methylomirabilota bacterium]
MAEQYIGEVRAMPFGFVPQGWAACSGQLLQPSSNAALFALLGYTYGGDGATTFALPNIPPLQGKQGSLQYCIAIQGLFPPR